MSRIEKYLEKIQNEKKYRVIIKVDQQSLNQLGRQVLEEAKKADGNGTAVLDMEA